MIDDQTLKRLQSQMSRGELVLFTGAGFSMAARDRKGRQLPSVEELKGLLWEVLFPGQQFEPSSLGDLFDLALRRKPSALREIIEQRLAVDAETLPEFYRLYFEFPWLRVYTLNVDDVEQAVLRRHTLGRPIVSVSATRPGVDTGRAPQPLQLEVIHLNGIVPGPLESLTFSETQYAERIARQEVWYSRCVAEITTRPVVFVGTELREVPLWQHLELRRQRTSGGRDLRPSGLLVAPQLSQSRRELLRELRLDWVEATAEQFAEEVLTKLIPAAAQGATFLATQARLTGRVSVPLVAELAAQRPDLDTEYLMGAEPQWSDLLTGRAVPRSDDQALYAAAHRILSQNAKRTALAITGTAGTGKSTALMRLALRLSSEGTPVLWVDRDSQAPLSLVRQRVREAPGPIVLAIDDADLFGRQLSSLIRELVPSRPHLLFVVAMRATKLDELSNTVHAGGEADIVEHTVPNLTTEDIDSLIETLDRHNRLGVLKGRTARERRQAFEEEAGRQLLVAMFQATSGRRFEEKVHEELLELEEPQRFIYALIAVASASRLYVTRDEIVIGSGALSGDVVLALDRLVARHLVVAPPPTHNYRVRHRVVADLILDKLGELGQLSDVLAGLAFAAASKVEPTLSRQDRSWRLLARVINHAFLLRMLKVPEARAVYEQVENILSYDYHYWLQRGSLEVEAGDVRYAENFLGQALSLAPDDFRVQTAYSYMQLRRAAEEPHRADSSTLAEQALERLERVIQHRGAVDSYPYHVLGSQGLSWARRAGLDPAELRALLDRLLNAVEDGRKRHPGSPEISKLHADLKRESLMTVVSHSPKSGSTGASTKPFPEGQQE